MKQTKRVLLNRPTVWFVIVVGISALVGAWNAEAPLASTQQLASVHVSQQAIPLEQMESTLAQAGCPGWIVLASEGEAALKPPSDLLPNDVKKTALRVASNVPRISYPTPVRVASRTLFAPPPGNRAQLATSTADDPNDLLDGVPDLLAAPVEKSTAPSIPKAPTPSAHSTPGESASADGLTPKQPPPPQPTTQKLDLPAPQPQTEELPKTQPAPPQPAPQPAPPQIQQPEQIEPPRPVQQPEPVEVPTITPNPQPLPQQSPFAPPPTPQVSEQSVNQSAPHSTNTDNANSADKKKTQSFCEFVAETQFPSAQACAKCHEKIYDEWSISSHAYAMVSPMFHKFEQTLNDLSQGTVGYFCYRCHSPVGTTLGISRAAPLWELPLVAREGITCIACHRVNQRYGKVNGDRRIEPGSIHAPVYGSIGGSGVAEVIAQKSKYKVKTSPNEKGPGQDIHVAGLHFDQLSKSEFCVSCHQVAVHPGIKLEVVWEQYRASPACKKGISCQDCHMGRIPGVPSGYEVGAAAKVNDKTVNTQRKHANHVFYGPGYSIAHPGVFPFNIDANRWTMQEWLLFDWRSGWGTEKFEELLEDGQIRASFPPVWAEADDRYDARDIIDDNQKKLDSKKIIRTQVMENGSHVDGPFFDTQLTRGQDLKFHYVMTNTNEGHNLPTASLGAQPQLWANVVLIGPRGQRLWETGYTDHWGDVADIHSVDVRNKLLPYDWQLFNLQTMFLITGAKGTDREFYLPVNFDFDQLPYLRPGAQPISVLNHPPFIRMEGRSLAALGSRKIPYKVPAELMYQPGHYRLSFRLRSRLEPIYFMRFCGSTDEMIRSMNEGMLDFHQSSVEFFVR
ncbi:MAG: hypothetical protein GXP24_11155 [Planctomycetes bacterium]|nr:hypothetical protein [Planctomycetota bacterium]